MSRGAREGESVRRLSSYVDSIFRGAKPGDLVVDFPARSDLVINLKAAKAIGLVFPETLITGAAGTTVRAFTNFYCEEVPKQAARR